jgi:hypothetical protein
MAPSTMRAVVRDTYGSTDVARVDEVPRPVPGPGEALVRVHTASLNTADLNQPGSVPEGAIDADAFNAFEVAGWDGQAARYDDFFGRITSRLVDPLLDVAGVGHKPGSRR